MSDYQNKHRAQRRSDNGTGKSNVARIGLKRAKIKSWGTVLRFVPFVIVVYAVGFFAFFTLFGEYRVKLIYELSQTSFAENLKSLGIINKENELNPTIEQFLTQFELARSSSQVAKQGLKQQRKEKSLDVKKNAELRKCTTEPKGAVCLKVAKNCLKGAYGRCSIEEAVMLARKGCVVRNGEACYFAGQTMLDHMRLFSHPYRDSELLFKAGCKLGHRVSCKEIDGNMSANSRRNTYDAQTNKTKTTVSANDSNGGGTKVRRARTTQKSNSGSDSNEVTMDSIF